MTPRAFVRRSATLLTLAGLTLTVSREASADTLLTNGGFETGDFTGWVVRDSPGLTPGSFYIGTNTLDPVLSAPATPLSEFPTVGARTGSYYAVSDSLGPGAHVLLQSFTVPLNQGHAFDLRFDMFVNDWNGAGAFNANGPLDSDQPDGSGGVIPTQFARVDLLRDGADAFSTDPFDVLANFYLGVDGPLPPYDYSHYAFDLSDLMQPGGTYQVRFSEVDNQFTLNQGVDNVSVDVAPEGSSLALFTGPLLLGAGGLLHGHLRRRCRPRRSSRSKDCHRV